MTNINLGARKICLVGDFFVGKTSLASRFHSNTFSEKYLATVGVSINTKVIELDGNQAIKLVVWDLASIKDITSLNINYLKSSSGIAYVIDITRRSTLDHALYLQHKIDQAIGKLPCIFLINKSDLKEEIEISAEDFHSLDARHIDYVATSALTGVGVNEGFIRLAKNIC